jgi:hypothetical protein
MLKTVSEYFILFFASFRFFLFNQHTHFRLSWEIQGNFIQFFFDWDLWGVFFDVLIFFFSYLTQVIHNLKNALKLFVMMLCKQ